MKQLIECVPNFSEGNDLNIIKQITDAMETVEGVLLLNVDPGKATNRTVVTVICLIIFKSFPSLKLGTHSISCFINSV